MGLLNHLFSSTEAAAKEIKKESEDMIKKWEEYLSTLPKKEEIINRLPFSFGEKKKILQILKQLLDLELADVFTTEREDDLVVVNFHSLDHSKKIKRVHRLEDCLRYFETRHEYVYELLRHLYSVLKQEASLLKKLANTTDLRKYRIVVSTLKSELVVEKTVIKKISDLDTFGNIFSAIVKSLVKGEEIIHKIDAEERMIIKEMQKKYPIGSKMDQWVMEVFNAIEDQVHEAVEEGILEHHFNVDLEFVNRLEFVDLVAKVSAQLGMEVSKQEVNVFVHLFREKYNHERD